jgi:hypothetical protein
VALSRGAWGKKNCYNKNKRKLETAAGAITLIELSDKKPDKPGETQREGFDHIEIYPTAGTMRISSNSAKSWVESG